MAIDRVGKASSTALTPSADLPVGSSSARLEPSSQPLAAASGALPARTSSAPGSLPPRGSAIASTSARQEIELADVSPPVALQKAAEVAAQGVAAALVADNRPPLQKYVDTLQQYGATREQLQAFETSFGAHFIPSASAGKQLASMNDHVGLLKIPAYDGPPGTPGGRTIVAEQFAVIKAQVPSADAGQPAGERFFVKGYGDRLIDFSALEKAMAAHSPHVASSSAAAATGHEELDKVQNKMETPLRSEIKRLSNESELVVRRDGKESDTPVMPLPPNDTKMAWRESWANSEAAMCPGAGPMLANGTRKFQLDYNATENRLIIFRNDNGNAPRKESILSDSLPGEVRKLAPAWCEGPTLAEIHGIKGWELMGPALDHKGVKQGNTQRRLHAAKEKLFGRREPDLEAGVSGLRDAVVRATPGAHIRITTEDGAVHDLKVDKKGIKLSLANPQPAKAHQESMAAFGGAGKVQADVDVYSYHGRDTGVHGSKTGFADPKLVTSTGDQLKAGPLLKDHGATLGQAALRLVTFQPLVDGQDRSMPARLANTLLNTASKFLYVWATSAVNEAMKGGQDGHYLPGIQPISASGAGSVSRGQLALAAAGIVAAQEAVTMVKDAVSHVVPEPWKRRPEGQFGKILKQTILPMCEEMARLMINAGVQKGVGIVRGGAIDYGTLAGTSVAKGAIETWRQHAGSDRSNHPVANTLLDVAQGVQYNVARAIGNAGSSQQGLSAATFSEALLNRLVTRGYDQIATPAAKDLLNTKGLIGPNASAFDGQLSQEYRIEHLAAKVGSAMKGMLTELDAQGFKDLHAEAGGLMATLHANTQDAVAGVARKLSGPEFHSGTVLLAEQVKQRLNRVDLALEQPSAVVPDWLKGLSQQLGLMKKAIETEVQKDPSIRDNVQRAGHFAALDPQSQLGHLQKNEDRFDNRVKLARDLLAAGEAAAPAGVSPQATPQAASPLETSRLLMSPMTNSLEETARPQQKFVSRQVQALADHVGNVYEAADHSGRKAQKSMLERPVPSASNVDYGLVQRPFGSGGSARIPRAQTTFSTLPQSQTYEKNRRMAQEPGIDSIKSKDQLPPAVQARIEMAVRDYTVESQFFHYPLRWQVTGELQHEKIAPGIDVPYNVMNRRGNTDGSKNQKVDPIEALYINLGAQVSDKFPTEMFRAVVTEAAYKARLEGGEKPGDAGLMTVGSKGVLTEILSATMSTPMAAGFNLPISNYGSAPRENSLRIDMNQESGVNIAKWADLVQGEVIMMPGAVMQVELVDKTAGKGAKPEANAQDIGQVVYMKAVDTYALELAHDAFMAYKHGGQLDKKPEDGALMIDPKSGHFFKFVAGDKNDIEAISETKNYFTGRQLESVNDQGQPGTEEARWRKPYTSDGATRATKDAIHMAILRGDPIVPFLDQATENVHHAWFSKKAQLAGTFNVERGRAEDLRKEETRTQARGVAGQITQMNLDTPLRDKGTASTEMLAWLATSMLRQPIQLVPVDDSGAAPKLGNPKDGTVINQTYDKVDLQHARQSITGRNPPQALLIGVGERGYYAVKHDGGEFKPQARIGEDKSLGNLLHAVVRAGYAKPSQHVESDGKLTPDARAQASVDGLLDKMKQFVQTEYLVLQQALVKKNDEMDPKGKRVVEG